MVRVDRGRRVNLQTVVVVVGILEETVHRVENLMGHVEEPLPETASQHCIHKLHAFV